MESLAAEKGLDAERRRAADLPPGRGDERRLTQVLLNLVGNAIKFTEAGEVRDRGAGVDGDVRRLGRDTGPGIRRADQAQIFEEFQQADSSSTRKKGGTGPRAWRSPGGSWSCTAGASGWNRRSARARPSAFSIPVRVERQAARRAA